MNSSLNIIGLMSLLLLGVAAGIGNAWANGVTAPGKLFAAGCLSGSVAIVGFLVNKRKSGGAVDLSRIPVPIQDLLIALGDTVKEWRVEQKQQERQAVAAARQAAETTAQQADELRAQAEQLHAQADALETGGKQ